MKKPTTRRWLQMGAELEGGWDSKSRQTLCAGVNGAKVQHDGSVKIKGVLDIGEITTRPHATLERLLEDLEILHPEKVNDTCGYHIHTSHTPIDYSVLTTPEFWTYFRKEWKAWGIGMATQGKLTGEDAARFWNRYEGRNPGEKQFCKAEFKPMDQLSSPPPPGSDQNPKRYTQVNFAAYHKYKTMELRMLPMFTTVELTLAATQFWSNLLDTFLNEHEYPAVEITQEIEDGEEVLLKKTLPLPSMEYFSELEIKDSPKSLPEEDDGVLYAIKGAQEYMKPWVEFLNEAHE